MPPHISGAPSEIDGDPLLFPIAKAHGIRAIAPAKLLRQIKRLGAVATLFGLGQGALGGGGKVALLGVLSLVGHGCLPSGISA